MVSDERTPSVSPTEKQTLTVLFLLVWHMQDCTRKFVNYLVDQTPHFQDEVIKAFHPMSGTWLGKVQTQSWSNFQGTVQYFDKYEQVFPNPLKAWQAKDIAACSGTPCDVEASRIGWGWSRYSVYKEISSWESALLCFDQIRDVSHARDHLDQIINNILRPATDIIMSYYMKKRAAMHAKTKKICNPTLTDFTFEWVESGDDGEIYIDTNADPTTVYKLSPQALQRMVMPMTLQGYMDTNVLGKDFPRLIELITGMETTWELMRQANSDSTTPLSSYWRYTDWTDANNYWRYGFSGQLGNYAISVDPFELRFNYVGKIGANYRYQVVLPYRNVSAEDDDGTENWQTGAGLRMEPNPDYEKAQYAFTYIWHRAAGTCMVADATSVHPDMPFMARDLAGKWQFVTHDLGCPNYKQNKGLFYADFELAWKPSQPELSAIFFHKREPACVPEIETCNDDPGHPTQYYDSANERCDLYWDLGDCEEGEGIEIENGDITVNGQPLSFGGTGCVADLDALVAALNANAYTSALGTWEASDPDGDSEDELVLTNPTADDVDVVITCCTRPT